MKIIDYWINRNNDKYFPIKRIIIVVILLLTELNCIKNNNPNDRNEYFLKVKDFVSLKKNERLIILFYSLGSCSKCFKEREMIFECLLRGIDLNGESNFYRYKIMAMIACNREKEMQLFKNQYDWNHYIYLDKGNAKKILNLPNNTKIALFDYYGKSISYYLEEEGYQQICLGLIQNLQKNKR